MKDFPLLSKNFGQEEIEAGIGVLKSGNLTMGAKVREFESKFAKYVGAKYAVFCNSGSSANLLISAALTNPLAHKSKLQKGDKVGVPAISWSTSIWPLLQSNLVPVLIDVKSTTLNMCEKSLERAIKKHNLKAILLVHVLGNCADMDLIKKIQKKYNLILIEDTCEALGSKFRNKYLGTFGDYGSFSFYFSHHITTIEGGMVITNNKKNAELLRVLRSHGWSRELSSSSKSKIMKKYPDIDPRFTFVNLGYNLRPTEINAAFGLVQLKYLSSANSIRINNYKKIQESFKKNKFWDDQLLFINSYPNATPAWFGFPFLLNRKKVKISRKKFVRKLMKEGIDTRPIISGNMAKQPFVMETNLINLEEAPFDEANEVHLSGIFIGVHSTKLDSKSIDWLVSTVIKCAE